MVGAARSQHRRRVGPVIVTDGDAEVAAVVIGVLGHMGVAGAALVTAGRHAIVVGDPVAGVVGVVRLAPIGLAEQHRLDAGRLEVLGVAQEIFGPVVLVVAVRIVHRQEILVPHRHLPDDQRPVGVGMQSRHVGEPAREVGQRHVGAIPPVRGVAVPGRVMVGHIIEDQVPGAAIRIAADPCRIQKARRLVGDRVGIERRIGIGRQVAAGRPQRVVDRQADIGRVAVAQAEQRKGEALRRVRHAGQVDVARAGNRRRQGRG